MAISLALCAQGPQLDDRFKLRGFGTLGLIWNRSGQAGFIRDVSQPDGARQHLDGRIDSRLGLQGDAKWSETLAATLQVVSKYRYDGTFMPDLSWAFVGWSPRPNLEFRGGRLGVETLMDADSRDVGSSFLWVRPPVECFGDIPVSRLDGVDLAGTVPVGGQASLRLKAFFGLTSERLPLPDGTDLNLDRDRIGGLILEAQGGVWRTRFTYARFKVRGDFPPPFLALQTGLQAFAVQLKEPQLSQTAAALRFSGGTLQWLSVGVAGEPGPIRVQAMVLRKLSDRIVLPPSWAGFASLGYRLGSLEPYAVWSRIASQGPAAPDLGTLPGNPAPRAVALVEGIDQLLASNDNTQSTMAAGVRWDFLAKADLKFQVDRIAVTRASSFWINPQPGWDGRALVVSAVLDFVF
jgi:hypothetical protein